jgi:hypothetical protein
MLQAELQDEEFQEADILWPDAAQGLEKLPAVYYYSCSDTDDDEHDELSGEHGLMRLQIWQQRASSPIDIPGRKGEKGAKAQPGSSKLGASRASSGGGGGVNDRQPCLRAAACHR